jgi:hypothetical protein
VIESLQHALDELTEGGDAAAVDRLADLVEAEKLLEGIRREASSPQAEQSPARTAELAERTKQLAEELDQLQAADAARSADEAAMQLDSNGGSPESARSAQEKLAEAQQELAAERRRQETLVSKLKVERLDAALRELIAEQQNVAEEVLELHGRRDAKGSLNQPDQAAAQRIANEEAQVQKQTLAQSKAAEPFPVFARLLRTAADRMGAAATRLRESNVGDDTARLAAQALADLELLASTLEQQRQQQSQPPRVQQENAKPHENENEPSDPNQVQKLQLAVAQLALLRDMQADLQRQTAALEQEAAVREINETAIDKRSEELALQQRELTELAKSLVNELSSSDDTSNSID